MVAGCRVVFDDVGSDQMQHKRDCAKSAASVMHRNPATLMDAPKAVHQSGQQAPQLCATSEAETKYTNNTLFYKTKYNWHTSCFI